MTVLLAGAKGDTAKEISQALKLTIPVSRVHDNYKWMLDAYAAEKKSELGDQEFTIANSLWIQHGFPIRSEYKHLVSRNYGAQVHSQDLRDRDECCRVINQWVSEKTAKKIPAFIAPTDIDVKTQMIVVNSVYLNYPWQFPFKEADTKKDWFYTGETKKEIPFMHGEHPCGYYEGGGISLLVFSYMYLIKPMSIYLLLPKSPKEFSKMESKLTSSTLSGWSKKTAGYMVSLSMPKIKIDSRNYLRGSLESLGIVSAFSAHADYSGIATKEGSDALQLKNIHQTYFCADEKGTEAAAATAGMLWTPLISKRRPLPRISFNVNRPFLFIVRDESTGLVLFLGRFAG